MVSNQLNIFTGKFDNRLVSDARGSDESEARPTSDTASEGPNGFLPILMQLLPAPSERGPSQPPDGGDPAIAAPHEGLAVEIVQGAKVPVVQRPSEPFAALVGFPKTSTPIEEKQSATRIQTNDLPRPILTEGEKPSQEPTKGNSPHRTNSDGSPSSNTSSKTASINTTRNGGTQVPVRLVSHADRTTGYLVTASRAELTNRIFHATHATPGSQSAAATISETPASPVDQFGRTDTDLFVGTSPKALSPNQGTAKILEAAPTPESHFGRTSTAPLVPANPKVPLPDGRGAETTEMPMTQRNGPDRTSHELPLGGSSRTSMSNAAGDEAISTPPIVGLPHRGNVEVPRTVVSNAHPAMQARTSAPEIVSTSQVQEELHGAAIKQPPPVRDERGAVERSLVPKDVSRHPEAENPNIVRGIRATLNPLFVSTEGTHEEVRNEKTQASNVVSLKERTTTADGRPLETAMNPKEADDSARQDVSGARRVLLQRDFATLTVAGTIDVMGDDAPTTIQKSEQTRVYESSVSNQDENVTTQAQPAKSSDASKSLPANESVRQQSLEGNQSPHVITLPTLGHSSGVESRQLGASAPAGVPVLPKEITESIIEQVSRELAVRIGNRGSEIRLILKPETLGELALKVKLEDGTMTAKIDVTQASVKAALEANLGDLRSALHARGIEVKSIDIFAQSHFSSNESRGQHPAKSAPQGKRRWAVEASETYQTTRQLGYNTIEVII